MINSSLTNEWKEDIRAAVNVLRSGGVILYPTDTVWGLGCDARNAAAVAKVFAVKQRQDSKALITLVGSMAQLENTVETVPEVAYDLLRCSDRPITIVYDAPARGAHLADALLAPDGSIGVRITNEPFSAALCRSFGAPLVSTSANISGKPAPALFAQISSDIIDAVDYVCMSRRDDTTEAQPSMVMRLKEDGQFKILRS